MNEKELRKLGRADLMQMILDLSQENAALRSRLEAAERKAVSRDLQIAQAGTMAEAALKLNGVFEAADAACKQYMDNIQRLTQELAGAACQQYMGNIQRLTLTMDKTDEAEEKA